MAPTLDAALPAIGRRVAQHGSRRGLTVGLVGLEPGFGRTRDRDVDSGAPMTCLGGSSYGPLLTTTLMLAPGRIEEFYEFSENEEMLPRTARRQRIVVG